MTRSKSGFFLEQCPQTKKSPLGKGHAQEEQADPMGVIKEVHAAQMATEPG